jgi:putative membrane protein
MLSDASAPVSPGGDTERRLHPFSWLFVLLTQLRQMALPLVALLVFARGDRWELLGLVSAVGISLYSLVYSFGFRYRLGRDELVVREGVLGRTERHIAYARIQNIVQQRNPLHRWFGVTELRLESAGGARPEAVMTVITVAEAARIEAVLRGHRPGTDTASPVPAAQPLLELAPDEVVRLGLVTNRGLVVVGAIVALVMQFDPGDARLVRRATRGLGDLVDAFTPSVEALAAAVLLLLALATLLKAFSVAVTLVGYHGFRLWRDGERLRTETGLLTRRAASARRDKIQRVHVGETWLSRRLHRQWLSCDVAAGVQAINESDTSRLRWLVPIGSPDTVARVLADVAPGVSLGTRQWRRLHPRAWRRRFVGAMLRWTVATAAVSTVLGRWAALVWVGAIAWAWFEARGWARFAGYSLDDEVLAVRAGWHARAWTLARVARGQVVVLRQSPFDRRHGMARVGLDTAGASATGLRLEVPYLAEGEARAVFARLQQGTG